MVNNVNEEKINHRTVVAQIKREKMKQRLLETALLIYKFDTTTLEKEQTIEDFIKSAGVSRGTFYNYYKTINDLLVDLAIEIIEEIVIAIEPLLLTKIDPIERICIAMKTVLALAIKYPKWGSILSKVGLRYCVKGHKFSLFLTRDLELTCKKNNIIVDDIKVFRDIFLGSYSMAIETVLTETVSSNYHLLVIQELLKLLGVSYSEVQHYTNLEEIDYIEINSPYFTLIKKTEAN